MNTKILASLMVIALVGTAAGAGTFAYFSDTETSTGNTFTAGTLDLTLGEHSPLSFGLTDKAPGDNGSGSATLSSVGSLAGELDIGISGFSDYACTNASHGVNDGSDYCDDTGNLGSNAEMALFVDPSLDGCGDGDTGLDNAGNTYSIDSGCNNLEYYTMASYSGVTWDAVRTMTSGDPDDIRVKWEIPSETGNEIQGDALEFDVDFTLEQPDKD